MLSHQRDSMRAVLFWVFVSAFCVLIIGTLAIIFFGFGSPTPEERSVLFKVFIAEVGLAVLALFYSLFDLKKSGRSEQAANVCSNESSTFFLKTYPRSQHPDFFAEVERLVPKAKNIVLIATGLNLIWEKHIIDMLVERSQSGDASVTICLGNPFSPHVEDRLVEEEMYGNSPPVGRDGVARSAKDLVQRMRDAGRPKDLSICLFEHYPTFATLIFDQHIFVYPYAYITLGNESPIFHLCNDGSEESKFFIANANNIIRDAVQAEDVVKSRKSRKFFNEKWIGAAVYIVPHEGSSFYVWGSEMLGYDLRNAASVVDNLEDLKIIRPYVGEAALYGFHATLADALFFATQAEIERVKAELRFLAEDFRPFVLSNFRVSDAFRGGQEIVLACDDPSGAAEAIHNELISRMYRVAISSTYLAGQTKKKVPPESRSRTGMMLSRYGSPYIMQHFQPHFTLCSSAPVEEPERRELLAAIDRRVAALEIEPELEVDEICLLTWNPKDKLWSIRERYPLRRTN